MVRVSRARAGYHTRIQNLIREKQQLEDTFRRTGRAGARNASTSWQGSQIGEQSGYASAIGSPQSIAGRQLFTPGSYSYTR